MLTLHRSGRDHLVLLEARARPFLRNLLRGSVWAVLARTPPLQPGTEPPTEACGRLPGLKHSSPTKMFSGLMGTPSGKAPVSASVPRGQTHSGEGVASRHRGAVCALETQRAAGGAESQ